MKSQESVAVIGAGIGGMSAAIQLAKAGLRVTILEKNERLGGKLNVLEMGPPRFDDSVFEMGDKDLTLEITMVKPR